MAWGGIGWQKGRISEDDNEAKKEKEEQKTKQKGIRRKTITDS